MKFWINTISKDHVEKGVAGSFTQANHGANHTLKRLSTGDILIFYSPRLSIAKTSQMCQKFTALGIVDSELYKVILSETFQPWRRKVNFQQVKETSIHDLRSELECTRGKRNWGYLFRRGLFEISEDDGKVIMERMKS
jgi:hypothetical protein